VVLPAEVTTTRRPKQTNNAAISSVLSTIWHAHRWWTRSKQRDETAALARLTACRTIMDRLYAGQIFNTAAAIAQSGSPISAFWKTAERLPFERPLSAPTADPPPFPLYRRIAPLAAVPGGGERIPGQGVL